MISSLDFYLFTLCNSKNFPHIFRQIERNFYFFSKKNKKTIVIFDEKWYNSIYGMNIG